MAASSSTAASTSTSVNPNSTSNPPFDVFINHRGPDVKNTFASYLYHRLNSFRLKVFLDREELQQGEYFNSQIEGAIRTASVHVAIFSARYAESTWCLNELLTMLESQGTIIPVFYHVKPSELRWTKGKDGVYARDLQKLEEKTTDDPQSSEKKPRHDSATIEQWRKALSTVSQINGFELDSNSVKDNYILELELEHFNASFPNRTRPSSIGSGVQCPNWNFSSRLFHDRESIHPCWISFERTTIEARLQEMGLEKGWGDNVERFAWDSFALGDSPSP